MCFQGYGFSLSYSLPIAVTHNIWGSIRFLFGNLILSLHAFFCHKLWTWISEVFNHSSFFTESFSWLLCMKWCMMRGLIHTVVVCPLAVFTALILSQPKSCITFGWQLFYRVYEIVWSLLSSAGLRGRATPCYPSWVGPRSPPALLRFPRSPLPPGLQKVLPTWSSGLRLVVAMGAQTMTLMNPRPTVRGTPMPFLRHLEMWVMRVLI